MHKNKKQKNIKKKKYQQKNIELQDRLFRSDCFFIDIFGDNELPIVE